MTRKRFDPVNLDAMEFGELRGFAQNRDNPISLRVYAGHKANAIYWRLQGVIALALQYESRCDEVYRTYIPKRLKW